MKSKKLGQVFTPKHIVELVLSEAHFTVDEINVRQMKTVEPSFGDGAFLKEVATRMAVVSLQHVKTRSGVAVSVDSVSSSDIEAASQMVDDNLHGIELDRELYLSTVEEIKEHLYDKFGMAVQLPNLVNGDALDSQWDGFDYVVGNPPYVRIHNIDEDYRDKVRLFSYSGGNTDLYVIFIEMFKSKLSDKGRLSFIVPQTWLRNTSQRFFRRDIIAGNWLESFKDYGEEQVFAGFGTYASIITLSKGIKKSVVAHIPHGTVEIPYENLKALDGSLIAFNGAQLITPSARKLSEISKAANGISTLGDKHFIIEESDIELYQLESDFIFNAVKGSKYYPGQKFAKIFFPYHKINNKWVGITEEHFEKTSPNLYQFMLNKKTVLEQRDRDKKSLWFWYGRSQAIQSVDKPKIMVTPIIKPTTTTVQWHKIPANTLIYSALFIIPPDSADKQQTQQFQQILQLLESEDFCSYAKSVGRTWSGGYKMISSTILNDFDISSIFKEQQ